ncbi:MAG: hypothetical protein CVT64_03575 [Actinobacteria bacterium HGW-Actinobacteria-4]|nr:MAG: hypothetical protein CVT64_03575 [Actinobacteria bacterium HGW-Actinobacteria-4]
MSHLDDDVLAMLALGDPVASHEREHAATCDECARQVAEISRTRAGLESLAQTGGLLAPPPAVWEAISSQVRRGDGADELAARRERTRRSTSPWMVGVAAAAGLVIGGVGVATLVNGAEAAREQVAVAPLTNLETEQDAGVARVELRADGSQVLVLETEYEPIDGAALEVWLIDENVEGMISLGFLTSGSETFVIPAGFDVTAYPIVDVSVEPFDGDPTHSGQSVTRGVLDA